MTHKFKDQIIDWLNGGKYEYKLIIHDNEWGTVESLADFYAYEIRKVDEYKHLREAEAGGETIQCMEFLGTNKYFDVVGKCYFNLPADRYRIKPKTKKMVQWLYKSEADGNFYVAQPYFDIGIKPEFFGCTPIKPLPHTEIEVEE